MELEYIKELIKDLAAADGKTYEAYLEEKDITAEEFETMLNKGMQMDMAEFEYICKLTGMSQSTVINFCNAKSAEKRLKQADAINTETANMSPKEKAAFNRYMELLATDLVSGDIDVDNVSTEEVAEKYRKIIEKEMGV